MQAQLRACQAEVISLCCASKGRCISGACMKAAVNSAADGISRRYRYWQQNFFKVMVRWSKARLARRHQKVNSYSRFLLAPSHFSSVHPGKFRAYEKAFRAYKKAFKRIFCYRNYLKALHFQQFGARAAGLLVQCAAFCSSSIPDQSVAGPWKQAAKTITVLQRPVFQA